MTFCTFIISETKFPLCCYVITSMPYIHIDVNVPRNAIENLTDADTWLILTTALVLWLCHCVYTYSCANGLQTTRVRRSRGIYACVCVCKRVSEYGHAVASSAALVYVYTTYLEEFAGVLACICLTALTDPDPNISLKEPSMWLTLSAHRVGAKTGTTSLCPYEFPQDKSRVSRFTA